MPLGFITKNSMMHRCYSGDSSWSSEGVSTEVLENGRVRCVARHLTSFTVLLSPTGAEAVSRKTQT